MQWNSAFVVHSMSVYIFDIFTAPTHQHANVSRKFNSIQVKLKWNSNLNFRSMHFLFDPRETDLNFKNSFQSTLEQQKKTHNDINECEFVHTLSRL